MKYASPLLSILIIYCTGCTGIKNNGSLTAKDFSVIEIEKFVSELGSDRFLGRKPFTEGEAKTVNYLEEQLRLIGFEPAFNGSYFQEVPMAEISSVADKVIISRSSDLLFQFELPDEAAIVSPITQDQVSIENSEMIFAGFGIVAPEYGWNDYSDLDVRGKTVVVMINDPGLYTGDSMLFKGREMTYYGRWTYKYEEAARQGAEGIIIIHETEGAGYPYSIPRKSSITPRFYMKETGNDPPKCLFTGWFSGPAAEKLFRSDGIDVSQLRMKACKKGFKGFPMNMEISLNIKNSIRYDESINVAGLLRGSERSEECIVYTAHWDHFGIGERENGDSIYNGAVDNGTSMAWALSIGKAFSRLKDKPERSVMLLFPTSEEQGLIGSIYYTENPVFPMEKTVACLNNDLLLPIGRMKDVMITGYGQSELDDIAEDEALKQDRYIIGDPNSHTGMFFRSDHFAFAAKGVPSLYARGNTDSRHFGKAWAAQQEKDYIENRYHRPSDNYEPDKWDLEGVAEDAALAFNIGLRLVNSDQFPQWKEGSEFKKLRKR